MDGRSEEQLESGAGPGPIFVLGVLHRSGTNHLFDLLRCHPDCEPAVPIWEDFLVAHADHLQRYVDAVYRSWNPAWGVDASVRRELLGSLGEGLCRFLEARCAGRRVVTKTPSVDHCSLFFDLFPRARLVVLVRDGRAVVESGVRSFRWHRESAIRRFHAAATRIRAFEAVHARDTPRRHRIVRYEDLCAHPEGVLRELFAFLELDADAYDFDAVTDLPVRGSSALRARPGGRMHWRPVPKPADFDPTSRFAEWSRARHERFEWIAGESLRAFGYESVELRGFRPVWWVFNAALDLLWRASAPFRGALGPLRRRIVRGRAGGA